MKLTYGTKYNGKYYNAGEEIPVEEKKVVNKVVEQNEIIEAVEETVEKPKKATKKK